MNWPQPNTSKLTPVPADVESSNSPQKPQYEPGLSGVLRCQMPMTSTFDSDQMRQFYQTGIPQYRITPPPTLRKTGK